MFISHSYLPALHHEPWSSREKTFAFMHVIGSKQLTSPCISLLMFQVYLELPRLAPYDRIHSGEIVRSRTAKSTTSSLIRHPSSAKTSTTPLSHPCPFHSQAASLFDKLRVCKIATGNSNPSTWGPQLHHAVELLQNHIVTDLRPT